MNEEDEEEEAARRIQKSASGAVHVSELAKILPGEEEEEEGRWAACYVGVGYKEGKMCVKKGVT